MAQKEYFYQWPYTVFGDTFDEVLILGAGSGTDVAAALREKGVLVNAITPTALRLCPALGLARGEADLFCAALADVLGNVYATTPV